VIIGVANIHKNFLKYPIKPLLTLFYYKQKQKI